MVRSLASRRLPRSLALLLVVLLAAFLAPVITTTTASAAGQVIGGFEIDGNTTVESDLDWNSLALGDVFTGLDNTSASGQDASTFQGSSHEYSGGGTWPGWKYGGGNATGKSDFGRFAVYTDTREVGGSDHQFLYFAFDRGFGQGTGDYAFEFNQLQQDLANDPNTVRSQGDIRIILDDQGNGSITLDQDRGGLYRWVDPDQAPDGVALDADQDGDWVRVASGNYFATSNAEATIGNLPSWWTSQNVVNGQIGPDQFIEAGLDLTDFGAVLGCPSQGFTAANARSITGTGAGSLVDYIPFVPIMIPSTCSSLPIEKRAMNADGTAGMLLGGATFTITPDPRPGQVGGSLDVTDNDANDEDPADGKILVAPAKPGEYTIVEKSAPAGYIKDDASQEVTAPRYEPADVTTFLNALGRVAWEKVDAKNGSLIAGATFEIKATGGAAAAAPWNLDANPISVTDNLGRDVDGDDGEFRVVSLPTGSYELTETAAPVGYELDPTVSTFAVTTTAVVTPSYATFSNPRTKSRLTVEKRAKLSGNLLAGAQFTLYRDDNDVSGLQMTGPDPDGIAGTCTTLADGQCSVPAAGTDPTLEWGFTYYWVETVPPPGFNLPNDTVSDPIEITKANAGTRLPVAVFEDPKSKIVTTATSDSLPGARITDSAVLSGVPDNAEGSIVFRAYGPVRGADPQPTCTADNLAFTSAAVPVDGPGDYGPVSFEPTQAGTYYWIATYSGDPANQVNGVAGECGDEGETSTVTPSKPGISTVATPTSTLPDAAISDTAKVNPVTSDATGTVTFTVYGPNDADCTATAAATYSGNPITLESDGEGGWFATASSPTYTPTAAGTYRWIAAYSGDANNEGVSGECNDANETSIVEKAQPEIETSATPTTTLPSASISDTATVTGLTANATGTVTFSLYGPGDADCSTDSLVSDSHPIGAVVGGTAVVLSDPFVPTQAGVYRWIAAYSGDANNQAVSGECNDVGETSVVEKANPAIATLATPFAVIDDGDTISDVATITGATADATGTVTFSLYGPDDSTCATTPVFTSTEPVQLAEASLTATSAEFTPTAVGTYRWIAAYSGDANNEAVSGACNDEGETSIVKQGDEPTLEKVADPASGSIVKNGTTITYTVTAGNIGDVAIVDGVVTDLLPANVTVVPGSISDGGVLAAGVITWTLDFGPAGSDDPPSSYDLTYQVTVDEDTPEGSLLLNEARFFDLSATTTHTTPEDVLSIVKVNDPTGAVAEGDRITYTMAVSVADEASFDQDGVVVTDFVPGFDPARPDSAVTTFVPGSAVCTGTILPVVGTCDVSLTTNARGQVTQISWELGTMAPGQTTNVVFAVTVNDLPEGVEEGLVLNAAVVQSDYWPPVESNEVNNPVFPVEVLPEREPRPEPPGVLAFTGPAAALQVVLFAALMLLMTGVTLTLAARRRRVGYTA